jgi:hypothetical protein
MNMIKHNASKILVACLLAGLLGVFFFLYYFGHGDTRKLNAFTAAYENYDHAIADYSNAVFAANAYPITSSSHELVAA